MSTTKKARTTGEQRQLKSDPRKLARRKATAIVTAQAKKVLEGPKRKLIIPKPAIQIPGRDFDPMDLEPASGIRLGERGRDLQLFTKMVKVPEGMHQGKPFWLRPWQLDFCSSFDRESLRRIVLTMGRKNGKTQIVAFLVLCALIGPLQQRNGSVFSGARSREQASLVFNFAAKMIAQSSWLSNRIVVRDSRKELFCPSTGVTYRALSAEASTAFGLSPFMVIHDEVGQVRGETDAFYEALETAGGAHENFVSVIISTQAPTDVDLLSILIDDMRAIPDPRSVLHYFAAEPEDDPWVEATWRKANPALGDFRSLKELSEFAARAQRLPSIEPAFLNLYLNRRISELSGFLSPSVWKQCEGPLDMDLFKRGKVIGGLDLSQTTDLTSLVLSVEDEDEETHLLPFFWTPEDTLATRAERDRAPYTAWVKRGLLNPVPGVTIDYRFVAQKLKELSEKFDIIEVRYDRWRIEEFKLACEFVGCRVPLVPHGQGFKDMAPALDRTERIAMSGKLRHGAHPILTWNASNAVVIRDPAGNRKLDKARSSGKIDGLVAAVMAISRPDSEMEEGRTIYRSSSRRDGILQIGGEKIEDRVRAITTPKPAVIERDPFAGLED